MLKNYFIIAIRNLKKNKLFSLINILGLAVGMTVCLLILHYVSFEKSYDKFNKNYDRIFRLRYQRISENGTAVRFASCTPPAAARIRGKYPEVERIARTLHFRAAINFGDIKFIEERLFYAEPQLFDIFNIEFLQGDPQKGIAEPNRAFISETIAKKYFGNQNPMGKSFSLDKKVDYEVVGVFKDFPRNSHIKCDIVFPWKNLEISHGPDYYDNWGHTGSFTYLRLKPGADPVAFEKKLPALVEAECAELMKTYQLVIELKMQPLTDIHLNSHFMQEHEPGGDRDAVNFLFLIALFIIVMAWVNYINLSTARALTRAGEVGVRKVVGASRSQLMGQFFMETLIVNLAAVLLALALMELSLPFFRQITATPGNYIIWHESWFWPAILLMLLTGVFLSGLYPVLVMSSYQPSRILQGKWGGIAAIRNRGTGAKGSNLRRILVIFQFVMALVLITGTLTVYHQIDFMKNQSLGFAMDQVLVMRAPRIRSEKFTKRFETFREILLRNSAIEKFCAVTEVPGRQLYWDAGGIFKVGEDSSKSKNYQIVGTDYDFVDFFDLEMVAGRNFSRQFPSDKEALILNETAVRWMGFDSPEEAVKGRVDYWGKIYPIIGVMKNYHQQSLKEAFEPTIFRYLPHGRDVRGQFVVKIKGSEVKKTVQFVEECFAKFFPGNPFEYFFLDDYYNQQYQSDELIGRVFAVFSFLAIFITGLGIFALSAFMAVQRTKEIGIRKVVGAGVSQIVLLLTRDFMVLLVIAFLITFPIVNFGIEKWLNLFATRMTPGWWLFFFPLVIVAAITLLTTGAHVVKAALTNPVDALKYE